MSPRAAKRTEILSRLSAALCDAQRLAGAGTPGENTVLESDTAFLLLAHSRVQGSGAEGKIYIPR